MAEIRYKGQIYSGAASFGSADDVSYDNTDSGLSADNLQEAVDQLNSNLTFITSPADGTVSLSNGTITDLAYIDLPKGIYICILHGIFAADTTGVRALSISDLPTTLDAAYFVQTEATTAGSTSLETIRMLKLTNTTRIYFSARILGNTTVNVSYHIAILKIKG